MAYLFQKKYRRKDGSIVKMKKWTIRYYCNGKQLECPGFRDRRSTEAKALQLELKVERDEVGISDPYEQHRHTSTLSHIEDFKTYLERKGRPASYIKLKAMRVSRMLARCKRLCDITEDAVMVALKNIGKGAQTRNHYVQASKQFCRWAVRKRRLRDDPLIGLEYENVRLDPTRKVRRSLTPVEVQQLLAATSQSRKTYRKLSGLDRCMLYMVAVTTGLRASELASLRPADFLLEGDSPVILLDARSDKARRGVEQPLPCAIVPRLSCYLSARTDPLVWGSSWPEKAWKMVRADLREAGIEQQTVEGYFDFHAWRHTYISLLAGSNLQPKMVQDLARHSDIKLTMSRYAHTQRSQRSQAIQLLPITF